MYQSLRLVNWIFLIVSLILFGPIVIVVILAGPVMVIGGASGLLGLQQGMNMATSIGLIMIGISLIWVIVFTVKVYLEEREEYK